MKKRSNRWGGRSGASAGGRRGGWSAARGRRADEESLFPPDPAAVAEAAAEAAAAAAAREQDPELARQKGIALLARRDYGSAELRERLLAVPFALSAVETAIAALENAGFLDDGRYAEHFVAYHSGRGQGPRRIRLEMRGKGLPEHLVTGAIDEAAPVWAERAQALRRRRFGVEAPGTLEERARQSRFLLYRGFTPAQVRLAFVVDRVDLEDLDLDTDMPEDSAHVD